jgi:Rho GTPase-activating protein 1
MGDAKEQAKEQFARLQRSVQPRLTQLQGRVQTVPDRLQNLSERIPERFTDRLPDRLSKSFPRPGSPKQSPSSPKHSRSRSSTPPSSPPPPGPPPQLTRAPALSDPAYNHDLAALASKILYRSGTDPVSGGPLLILCAAAFPDANVVDYTVLLPYVLSNLPGDDELSGLEDGGLGGGYSVIFFAGGGDKKAEPTGRPTWKWTLQAYTLVGVFREIGGTIHDDMADGSGQLGRAVRKKIRKLWVVHEKNWIREYFAGAVVGLADRAC